ncbi:MAG: hypothetical protein AAB791_01235 [Patescibacteria group bacterium]
MQHIVLGHFKLVSKELPRQSLEASLFRCGCNSIAWARSMVRVMEIDPPWGSIEFKAVAVSVEELGFPTVATLEEIVRQGEENGLSRCFSRVGPVLVECGVLPQGRSFIVAMDPVKDANGEGVFEIGNGSLGACHAEKNASFPKDAVFVFIQAEFQ